MGIVRCARETSQGDEKGDAASFTSDTGAAVLVLAEDDGEASRNASRHPRSASSESAPSHVPAGTVAMAQPSRSATRRAPP